MVDYPDIIISVSISIFLIFTKVFYDKWQNKLDIKKSMKNELEYNREFIRTNPDKAFNPKIIELNRVMKDRNIKFFNNDLQTFIPVFLRWTEEFIAKKVSNSNIRDEERVYMQNIDYFILQIKKHRLKSAFKWFTGLRIVSKKDK